MDENLIGAKMKLKYSLFMIFSMLFLTACGLMSDSTTNEPGKAVPVDGGEYTDISATEFQAMTENKDFLLVNVHVPFEGDIPNTDLSIPFDQIEANLDVLPEDKNTKIVLYCRSGRMSGIAAEEMVTLGYTNIWNLDGGFNAWTAAGLPMEGN
jgi:rhodanese-related sulfurtransferase